MKSMVRVKILVVKQIVYGDVVCGMVTIVNGIWYIFENCWEREF